MIKNVLSLMSDLTLISKEHVLDKDTGEVFHLESEYIKSKIKKNIKKKTILSVSETVEEVISVDKQRIDFLYKTSDGQVSLSNGFLVEVYSSGTNKNSIDNGSERLYQEPLEDPLDENKEKSDSFSKYFILEVDVE